MNIEHISGRDAGKVMLYALSTCGWCRKTKQLLNDLGIAYDFIDVDLLINKEKEEVLDIIRKWNPAASFPTMVINDNKCIVGFEETNIRESLK